MGWYYIAFIVVFVLLILILITAYICFRLTFYSKNKPKKDPNSIDIPDDPFYRNYRDVIIEDVKYSRSLNYKEYSIKSFDGLKLTGRYFECSKGAPIEIMFHGYRGNAERDLSTGIKRAFKCGRNVLLINQRGSSSSEGHVISFGINERKDCLDWIKLVINEFGNDVKIILTGVSMGAATVLMASCMDLPNNVKGILADCGYNKPSDIIKKVIKEMKLPADFFYHFVKLGGKIFGKFNIDETSPYEAVQKSKVPIIFIHGDQDSIVPCDMSNKLYEACTSRKKIVTIEGSDHGVSYLVNPEKYINELNDFFKDIK